MFGQKLSPIILLVLAIQLNAHKLPAKIKSAVITVYHETTEQGHVEGDLVQFGDEHCYISKNNNDNITTFVNQQLPKLISPESYKLQLAPDLDKKIFTGDVEILFTPIINTKTIVLNAHPTLNIDDKVTIEDQQGKSIEIANKNYSKEAQQFTIELKPKKLLIPSQQYTVKLTFNGTLEHKDLKGFYLSTYNDTSGVQHVLATTQFESYGARRVFPCLDEPFYKATFNLSITFKNIKDQNIFAISNSPVLDSTEKGKVTFKTTPIMSTYLLAFVVSDFVAQTETISNNNTMTIYTRSDFANYAKRSLKFGKIAIDKLSNFVNIDYFSIGIDKLDQIGIPDFAAGAMENWGLVTFREAQLLFDNATSTTVNKNTIYQTITHEFAHQFFGDLVTPKFWKYIWLNEGFATYFQYMLTDDIIAKMPEEFGDKPSRAKDQFAVYARQRAFQIDGLNTTRPMLNEVETLDQVDALFDTIVYQKAASIIYMLENILTTNVFKTGLTQYLKNNMYKSVTPEMLWHELQNAYDDAYIANPSTLIDLGTVTVNDIGNSWMMTAGYPVVTVNTTNNTRINFKQHLFSYDDEILKPSKFIIPITSVEQSHLNAIEDNILPTNWLISPEKAINRTSSDDFVLINYLQTGYYRVNYDNDNWKKISQYLLSSKPADLELKPISQAQLIDDALNLARIGLLQYDVALNTTMYLNQTNDYIVWMAAINNFNFLDTKILGTTAEMNYKKYQQTILKPIYETLNFTKDNVDFETGLKLVNILPRACLMDLKECLRESQAMLHEIFKKPDAENIVKPDLQAALYCGGVRNGNDDDYKNMLSRYQKVTTQKEKTNVARGLGCFTNTDLLNKALDEATPGENKTSIISLDDQLQVYDSMISAGNSGVTTVLNYINNNYNEVINAFGIENTNNLLLNIARKLSTEDALNSVNTLLKKSNDDNKAVMQKMNSIIRANIDWNDKYLPVIEAWLENYYPSSGVKSIINIFLIGISIFITFKV